MSDEEVVALFSYQRTALFHCCSLKTSGAGKQPASHQELGGAASQKGWGGKTQRDCGKEQQKLPKLSFLQVRSVPHRQEAGERFLFPSCISKELVISHLSDTEELISELDFNSV